jgi:hypothetical protein
VLWQVIEKLSIRPPSGEVKLKLMKDIATELNADWDPTASESELLKAPEDLLVCVYFISFLLAFFCDMFIFVWYYFRKAQPNSWLQLGCNRIRSILQEALRVYHHKLLVKYQ